MIYPYVGDFLISPVPTQLSFNYCSHKCSYCFANLNNPSRTFDLKQYQEQIKGIYTRNDLQSTLLKQKYPVLISNLVDPFAISNYQISVPVIEQLTNMGIPVSIQTRGGIKVSEQAIDNVLSFLPRSVWYISIPMLSDEIRKKVEPAAPAIESRFDLIAKLKEKGHEVLCGINPTVSDWLPGDDMPKLLEKMRAYGVHGIWLAALHFNSKQMAKMPERDKQNLGETVISKGLKNARDLQKECFDFIDDMKAYALKIGLEVEGMFDGNVSNFFEPFKNVYAKTFPTVHDFINWCHANKKDNEPVYFSEFLNVMKGFPAGEHNLTPYLMCMSQKLEKEVRNQMGYKMSYKKLLWICWNDERMKRTLERYWSFKVGVTYDGKDMQLQRDDKGNLVYYFKRNGWDDDDEFLIVK